MLLKEDGSLDIDSVKKLNESEFINESKTWGPKQQIEWLNRGKKIYSEQEVWRNIDKWIGESEL